MKSAWKRSKFVKLLVNSKHFCHFLAIEVKLGKTILIAVNEKYIEFQ